MNVVRKWKKFLACSDSHGAHADQAVLDEVLSFKRMYEPDVTLHLGDAIDLACLRSRASEADLAVDPEADLSDGLAFLSRLEPQFYLLGNHEHRLVGLMSHPRAIVASLASRVWHQIHDRAKEMGTKVLEYKLKTGFVRLGDAMFQHGYLHGLNAVQHSAEQMCHDGITKLVMGHVHRNSVVEGRRIAGVTGYSIGWLGCPENASYAENRIATTMWSRGWAFGEYTENTKKKETQIWQIKENKFGEFRIPSVG